MCRNLGTPSSAAFKLPLKNLEGSRFSSLPRKAFLMPLLPHHQKVLLLKECGDVSRGKRMPGCETCGGSSWEDV